MTRTTFAWAAAWTAVSLAGQTRGAMLGTDTDFQGNILALASITMNTGATLLEGRALARTGAVTMDTNTITAGCIPAPGAVAMLGAACTGALSRRRR